MKTYTMTFRGERENEGKLVKMFTDSDGQEYYFGGKVRGIWVVGDIYEIEGDGHTFQFGSKVKLVGKHESKKDREEWSMLTRAARESVKIKNAEKKRNREASDAWKEALRPIKIAYAKSTPTGRLAIKALVLSELEKW